MHSRLSRCPQGRCRQGRCRQGRCRQEGRCAHWRRPRPTRPEQPGRRARACPASCVRARRSVRATRSGAGRPSAARSAADRQLRGPAHGESGVREHRGARRDDVQLTGQCAGVPAAQREDPRMLCGIPQRRCDRLAPRRVPGQGPGLLRARLARAARLARSGRGRAACPPRPPPAGIGLPRRASPSRRSTRGPLRASRRPRCPAIAAPSAVPSEFTAASRVPSGHGSGRVGNRSSASPDSMSGCGRTQPVAGGMVPAAITTAVLTRLAMPAAALVYPMPAQTAPSAATVLPPRLRCARVASSAESAAAVPVPWPSMSWMSAGSIPARR